MQKHFSKEDRSMGTNGRSKENNFVSEKKMDTFLPHGPTFLLSYPNILSSEDLPKVSEREP